MYFALYEATRQILEEGQEKVQARHKKAYEHLVAELEKIGLSPLMDAPHRMPMLTAVPVPEGGEDLPVRKQLRTEHKIEIGAGLGSLAGKLWRIGLMGYSAKTENVDTLIGALKKILKR
jgi:alanine-glyoxylate transaminase/serine-glyoxylate transaminase/serine-pyruvate transaminase